MVSDISYSQRLDQDGNRMKLVDIQYNLDGNRSMFVEFFFSHDGGVTFPVSCTAVTGDAGPFVQYGVGKTAVWDAAQDWDQQFTSQGRIMIKATYGDQPTGFPGLGQDGNQSNGGPVAMETVAIPFPAVAGPKYGPSWALREIYQQELIAPGKINAYPQQFHVDKFEVTKGAWNAVAQWGRANGYSDLMDVSEFPDLNSADLGFGGFENVVKWLNARSEMEGLVPVFYLELSERGHDINGDGNISSGPDSQYPTPEDYADPNFQDPNQDLNFDPDPNGNYQWDPGEYFVDRNGDGVFEPNEFDDWNGNGIQDIGLSTVYRVGSIMQQPPVNQQTGYADFPWDLFLHTKFSSNGYRLPDAYIAEAEYFAMGGRTEQSTMDPFSNEVIYATEWPWGGTEENPSEIHAVVPPNLMSMNPDFLVGFKAPNGYGLYDMIGNAAELSLGVSNWGAGSALYVPSYGGSAHQAPSTEIDPITGMMGTPGPALWMTPNPLAPTGFRAIRLEF